MSFEGICTSAKSTLEIPVTERCAVAFGDLLHLVVVSQHKEGPLEFAHSLYFSHHILVDAIHDLLHISRENSQSTIVAFSESS